MFQIQIWNNNSLVSTKSQLLNKFSYLDNSNKENNVVYNAKLNKIHPNQIIDRKISIKMSNGK